MTEAGVPATIQDLYDRYDRLITWTIHRASYKKLDPERIQDLRQQVYVRIMERDYLSTCRTYYETHTGRFSSSLCTLVRNLVLSARSRQESDPLAHVDDVYAPHRGSERVPEDPMEYVLPIPSHEGATEARNLLDVVGRRLDASKRRTSVRKVIETALATGDLHSKRLADATGANASTVRHYLVSIRAEVRRLGDSSCRTAATKSAPTSSGPESPRNSS
jgi:hypothetical protein